MQNTSEKKQAWLEELGINKSAIDQQNIICQENPTTFYIVDDTNKLKYSAENIGSMWDWATKKASNTFKNSNGDAYKTTIIIENIDLNCSEEKQWVPYSLDSETFDGQNHTISGIYINNDSDTGGLFKDATNATIKNIIIENGYIYTTNANGAGLVGRCSGIGNVSIINCVNKAEVYGSTNTGGIVGYIMRPKGNCIIEGCANFGKISSASYCGGIVGRILNETRYSKYKKLL